MGCAEHLVQVLVHLDTLHGVVPAGVDEAVGVIGGGFDHIDPDVRCGRGRILMIALEHLAVVFVHRDLVAAVSQQVAINDDGIIRITDVVGQ